MMVVPKYPFPVTGGLERQAHELAKALCEAGVVVQVISGRFQRGQPRQEQVDGVHVYRLPWSNLKLLRFLRLPFDLIATLHAARKSYDVIHIHQHSWFGLFTILCGKLTGKPVLAKLPNVGAFGIPGMLAQSFGRLKLAILLRSDALVAMSTVSFAELEDAGFPPGRILCTPNGIKLGAFPVKHPETACTAPCRVVFAGRLSGEKKLEVLLQAWREVQKASTVPVVLELWGEGPEDAALKRLCSQLNIEDSVFFRGHVTNVRANLPAADMFVLPSSNEGNSNAILEAMAAGLPIVSTRVGGTPMQVGPEGADFLSQPGDREALIQSLLTLIETPELRAALGDAMRRRVERFFDITRVAATYAEAYKRLKAGERDEVYQASNPVIWLVNSAAH